VKAASVRAVGRRKAITVCRKTKWRTFRRISRRWRATIGVSPVIRCRVIRVREKCPKGAAAVHIFGARARFR